jgi:hypothetical protein
VVHGEIRIIDYYEDNNKGVDHYAAHLLRDRSYLYHTIFLPHDAKHRDNIIVANTYEREFRKIFSATQTRFVVLPKTDKQIQIGNAKAKFPRCVFALNKTRPLIEQLGKYRKKWSEQVGKYLDEPLHNIACFIGETLIETDQGSKRIDSLNIGDKVLTPNGFRTITNTFKYKTKKLVTVKTKQSEIVCTPQHKIFTLSGLVRADSLEYALHVLTLNDVSIWKKILYHGKEKGLGFRDCFLSMNQKQLFSLMDTNIRKTNSVIGLVGDLIRYIELFGSFITGKFLKVMLFITKMVTNQITKLRICSFCPDTITNPCTCQLKREFFTPVRQFKKPQNLRNYGILQMKELNGIENMGKERFPTSRFLKKFVKYVKSLISPNGKIHECVQGHVEQNLDEIQEKTTKSERVLYAKKNLSVVGLENKRHVQECVELLSDTEINVYDLEVEKDHCYFANGILVSNSHYSDAMLYAMQAVNHIETITGRPDALAKHRAAVESRIGRV